jgi:hypothetical protein
VRRLRTHSWMGAQGDMKGGMQRGQMAGDTGMKKQ